MKTLSVLMTVYNGENFIETAIQSVLNQTFSDFDFIIVDDGSKDGSRDIIQQYEQKDQRIKAFYLNENIGISEAANYGLLQTDSKWVARIDQDDIWYSTKLEKQMIFLSNNGDYSLVASWVDYIDKTGNIIGEFKENYIDWKIIEKKYKKNEAVVFCHSTVIFDKNLALSVGGYHKQFVYSEDADLWNRLLECGKKMVIYPEKLAAYRIHGNASSMTQLHELNSRFGYVKFCIKERRSGKRELTYEEYRAIKQKVYRRINNYRKDLSRCHLKIGVVAYSNKQYFKFVWHMLLLSILNPSRMISVLSKKKIK
jgi:glycosyltransferase involved in cell wall biosynthesis